MKTYTILKTNYFVKESIQTTRQVTYFAKAAAALNTIDNFIVRCEKTGRETPLKSFSEIS